MPARRLAAGGGVASGTGKNTRRLKDEGFGNRRQRIESSTPKTEDWSSQYPRNLYITYHDLELALERRGYSLYRLLIGTLIGLAATTALFWNRIKHWGAQESASVATRTLEDEVLQKKAEELAKQLTNALLKDERTFRAVQTLLKQILSDPTARQDAAAFVSQLLIVLMQREDTKNLFASFLADVLGFEVVKNSAKDLAVWVAGHDYVVEKVKQSLVGILQDVDARQSGKDYAMDATLRTLQDSNTKRWLQTVVEDVFVDPQFQEKAGEALWKATKSGVLGIKSSGGQNFQKEQLVQKDSGAKSEEGLEEATKATPKGQSEQVYRAHDEENVPERNGLDLEVADEDVLSALENGVAEDHQHNGSSDDTPP
eukprot:CAMPEP_0113963420 /NCGR_PEP_ID=MMETSP0011_2-20120614/6502_1 /TAXON_ID=101924 /ORGANISM="Rhodosorus marinus" /LENGTH=369 /DNA_ID=CAMNT_0000975465 /DNA_START=601 /DNA_END=1710 /DNA_ORIENTATION=+ /assembly_acc=CAM_ASM_000156